MSRVDFYLHKAKQCEIRAREIQSVGDREQLMQIARAYREAADRDGKSGEAPVLRRINHRATGPASSRGA